MAEMKPAAQTIEQLRKRHEDLNNAKIKAGANLETAEKQLGDLKAAALKGYGTDDLETLKTKLTEMENENERKRSEYQSHLDKIEADLKEVDSKFNQPQGKK